MIILHSSTHFPIHGFSKVIRITTSDNRISWKQMCRYSILPEKKLDKDSDKQYKLANFCFNLLKQEH
jgi:hypothetical protein